MGIKVGERQKGSLPLTQERRHFHSGPPHLTQHEKRIGGAGRGEAACSSPIWSMEGSEQSWVVRSPRSWLQAGNSLRTAPTPQPEAPRCPLPRLPRPSSGPFHRSQQSRSGASLSSSWRHCSTPTSRRVEAEGAAGACGPKNTFMWQGRELRLSASCPGRPPPHQMAAVGEAPHQGQSGTSTTPTTR